MIWKYLIAAFAVIGFVLSYPYIKDILGLQIGYSKIIIGAVVIHMLVIFPLYYNAIIKQGEKDKAKYSQATQPWEK